MQDLTTEPEDRGQEPYGILFMLQNNTGRSLGPISIPSSLPPTGPYTFGPSPNMDGARKRSAPHMDTPWFLEDWGIPTDSCRSRDRCWATVAATREQHLSHTVCHAWPLLSNRLLGEVTRPNKWLEPDVTTCQLVLTYVVKHSPLGRRCQLVCQHAKPK